jgi:ribonuclease HI
MALKRLKQQKRSLKKGVNMLAYGFFPTSTLQIYTDGAIRPQKGVSGLGAIVRDDNGKICNWWSKQTGVMTNNEAEYSAAIMALERLQPYQQRKIIIFSDSEIMVQQMQGHSRVRASSLMKPHKRLRELVARFPSVSFIHVPRERNRLADALANDAADGIGG